MVIDFGIYWLVRIDIWINFSLLCTINYFTEFYTIGIKISELRFMAQKEGFLYLLQTKSHKYETFKIYCHVGTW